MKRLLWMVVVVAACTDTAQVAGTYRVALTNGPNGCNYSAWSVGAQSSGVVVQFTQTDVNVSATVMGADGVVLGLALGTNVFTGSVHGSDLDLQITGTVPQAMGNCAYTRDAEIVASYANNSISGTVRYTDADNANSDCLPLCVSTQDFAGSRPPP